MSDSSPPGGRPSVLMVTENFLPVIGGTEKQLGTLVQGLRAHGVSAQIITPQRGSDWPLHEQISGVLVHRIPYPKVRWLGILVLLARLAAFLLTQGGRFSVFHVHTVSSMAVLTVLVARMRGKPAILKPVGSWEVQEGMLNADNRRRLLYRALLALLRRADIWVAVNRKLRDAILEAGVPPDRVIVVPNGVDTERFTPPKESRPADRDRKRPHVLFVGRLAAEKDLPVLFHAWSHVLRPVPGAVLDIVGSGPLESELKALATQLGINDSLRFHGEQPAVLPFLHRAMAFVLPSRIEGLSNALLEAMATELPVIATRISGNEDLINHGVTGLLVPPADAPALATAILQVLENPPQAEAMGREARRRIVAAYSLERLTDQYLRLYQSMIQNGAGASQVTRP